jgi:hypothetical protein
MVNQDLVPLRCSNRTPLTVGSVDGLRIGGVTRMLPEQCSDERGLTERVHGGGGDYGKAIFGGGKAWGVLEGRHGSGVELGREMTNNRGA